MELIFILTGLIGIFMIILIPVCLFLSIKGTLISRKIKNEGNDQNAKFTYIVGIGCTIISTIYFLIILSILIIPFLRITRFH